jgi:hypothetical protein
MKENYNEPRPEVAPTQRAADHKWTATNSAFGFLKNSITVEPSGVVLRFNKSSDVVSNIKAKTTNFVNLTSHPVTIECNENDEVAVVTHNVVNEQIADLLLEPKENTVYIVSSQVAEVVRRPDVLSPGQPITSATGAVSATRNLQSFK